MFVGASSDHAQVLSSPLGRSSQVEPVASSPTGEAAPRNAIPIINPSINFNYQAGIAVIEIRNSQTGAVEEQYPSKKVVAEYIRHGASSQDSAKPAAAPAASQESGTTPAVEAATPVTTLAAAAPAPVSAPAPAPAAPAPSSGTGSSGH